MDSQDGGTGAAAARGVGANSAGTGRRGVGMTVWKRIASEPLVHFLVLGAALFGLHAWLSDDAAEPRREQVVVSAGQIEHLTTTFVRTWQRPPTAAELKGLIDDYVEETILAREAIKLGLDRDDTVIRRRLRQKMVFLTEDMAAASPPSEAELQAHLEANMAAFRERPRFSFRQVYVSPNRGDALASDMAALLEKLQAAGPEADIREAGDRLLIPSEFEDETWQSVASQFGPQFPQQLEALAVGRWSGPVESGYGMHLVVVTERTRPPEPTLAQVRGEVERELMAKRREQVQRAFVEGLADKYEVTIEWPDDAAATGGEPNAP